MKKIIVVKVKALNGLNETFIDTKAEQFFIKLEQILKNLVAQNSNTEVEIYNTENMLVGYFKSYDKKLEYTIDQEKVMGSLVA